MTLHRWSILAGCDVACDEMLLCNLQNIRGRVEVLKFETQQLAKRRVKSPRIDNYQPSPGARCFLQRREILVPV
jgi:hypothetical protein